MLKSARQVDPVPGKMKAGDRVIMDVQCSQSDNGIATLMVKGEIDMNSCAQLRTYLMDLFQMDLKGIVVDLSKVSYIDSFGIATLVEGLQWSHNNNTIFRLTGLTPAVKDVFNIASLLTVFEIYDSLEDALQGL